MVAAEAEVFLRFTKMHALGNDFVALNGFEGLPVSEAEYPALAVAMCERRFGVGADGLFVAAPSVSEDARMLFYNPDGSPDRCGNGLRCFGRFLHDEGVTRKTDLTVETFGGPVSVRVHRQGDRVGDVRVNLGPPDLRPQDIPLDAPGRCDGFGIALDIGGRTFMADVVSTGTPHAVLVVDALPDEETFQTVSPAIETHPIFPEKTSVMWTRFVGRDRAEMRIWERVTGETLGCGTGAAAVAVVAHRRGLADGPVRVRSKGGDVLAAWDGGDVVTLSGPATVVYTAQWRGAVPG